MNASLTDTDQVLVSEVIEAIFLFAGTAFALASSDSRAKSFALLAGSPCSQQMNYHQLGMAVRDALKQRSTTLDAYVSEIHLYSSSREEFAVKVVITVDTTMVP